MSAFLVTDSVFAAVARFLRDCQVTAAVLSTHNTDAVTFAYHLRTENHRALNHRYSDPMPEASELFPLNLDRAKVLTPREALKQLTCIGYQCSEHKEFETTEAIVDRLKEAIAGLIVEPMPIQTFNEARAKACEMIRTYRLNREPTVVDIATETTHAIAWGRV